MAGAAVEDAVASVVGSIVVDSSVQGDGDSADAFVWAAMDFAGGTLDSEPLGLDPRLLELLEVFSDWRGRDELGWSASEVGFRNGGADCYMISLIQMLGTACRVRQAIRELPTSDAADTSRQARLTSVLQQDFCQPDFLFCAAGKDC